MRVYPVLSGSMRGGETGGGIPPEMVVLDLGECNPDGSDKDGKSGCRAVDQGARRSLAHGHGFAGGAGVAGGGKSFVQDIAADFIKMFTHSRYGVLKVAPTGRAAQEMGGVIIDRAFKFKRNDTN